MDTKHHNLEPFFDKNSQILILGSFPSVKSREQNFYYAHPQNRFYKVLSAVFNANLPQNLDEKKEFLSKFNIALFDVIKTCQISGSSDLSIKNAVPNDISQILKNSQISKIYTNGATASKLYQKHIFPKTNINAISLPSTSPANAKFSLKKLVECWRVVV